MLFQPPWPSLERTRLHLVRLVSWLIDLLDQNLHYKSEGDFVAITKVKQIILQSLDQPFSVKKLAKEVGLSPNYLSSLFHQKTRMTISHFISTSRVEMAKKYLVDPQKSIKEVSFVVGFRNPHHFSNVFWKTTGMRPSDYQRVFMRT